MSLTLLFDLDDTLLDTNIEAFVPAYFHYLSECLAPYIPAEIMRPVLFASTKAMMENENPSFTLQEVFEEHFYGNFSMPKNDLVEILDDFYENTFPRLESVTQRRPDAVPLIEWALSKGYRVAIATDPLFPCKATYHRLEWAGFDPSQFELVTTYEDFHFSKANTAYYSEVLGRLGWPDGPVLMVGNEVKRDLLPAHRLGLKTYFLDGDSVSSPGFEVGRGRLADLRPWLESTNLSTLEPSFKSRDSIIAIMQSTPAVLTSMLSTLTNDEWHKEVVQDDWAMNELICHLRDTEREIHQIQLTLMLERDGAFIPRPDTGVWASERDYLHIDGASALREFVSARMGTIDILKKMDGKVWSYKARHAIFGPTNFLEVCGFMADHDRMHIQQAWKTLKSLWGGRVLSGTGVF